MYLYCILLYLLSLCFFFLFVTRLMRINYTYIHTYIHTYIQTYIYIYIYIYIKRRRLYWVCPIFVSRRAVSDRMEYVRFKGKVSLKTNCCCRCMFSVRRFDCYSGWSSNDVMKRILLQWFQFGVNQQRHQYGWLHTRIIWHKSAAQCQQH